MAAPTELPAGTWQLDPSTSTVTVTVKKMGLFTVPATLVVTSGTVEIDDSHQVTNVEIVADAASYASKNAKRNEHVLGADFLDVENHPTITFRSGRVESGSAGYISQGTVAIKGQSSPIDVTITNVDVDGANGSFAATATVDRMALGVDKLPTLIVGRSLQLNVSANAQKDS
jgi:polyisoprenoid-binding protein YceI